VRFRDLVAGKTIGELVRRNVRAVTVFADAGISPRYVSWTVADAALDCGVSVDSLLARLERVFGESKPAAA
jgi:hypothetical protein